ncbi:MAG TPA: UDP-N-acetylmuramoyl-tripeptide--D-alanyl-D-alanine ligase, partial [Sporomusaceae bacterium]|nr:UDP-N-acetylmuramoyl-tripeptide--D-alanyl-D-alanine ligase [Sporomusaceae bacterium]
MADFTVAEVCTATKGLSRGGMEGARFQGVCTDTRTVQPGNLFIALTGERFDGHEFIRQAIEKGAAGVVISKQVVALPEGIAVIVVENTLKALQDLAQFHRRRFQIPVIAITGSNGKTTTKDLTAAILASKLRVLKTEANFNNEIGLPRTLLNMTSEHQVAVVEMGM